jgi:hypothetical protein
MKFLKFVGAVVLLWAFIWGLTLYAGRRIIATPDNARVILDVEQHTYASPPCAVAGHTERDLILHDAPRQPTFQPFAVVKTLSDVRDEQKKDDRWRADRKCIDADGFVQEQTIWARVWSNQPLDR